jgi:hypothetical protein
MSMGFWGGWGIGCGSLCMGCVLDGRDIAVYFTSIDVHESNT